MVDGRNPANPLRYIESWKYWDIYIPRQLVQDFFHQADHIEKNQGILFFLNLNFQARRRKPTGESTSQKKNGETSDLIMGVSGKIRVDPANICWT